MADPKELDPKLYPHVRPESEVYNVEPDDLGELLDENGNPINFDDNSDLVEV